MTKTEQIQHFLSQPIAVGDKILYNGDGNGSTNKSQYRTGTIVAIDGDELTISGYSGERNLIKRKINDVKRSTRHLGANPFRPELRLNSFKITIDSLLFRVSPPESESRDYNVDGYKIPEVSFDASVTVDGEKFNIQRTKKEEQWQLSQKVRLIDSIYNRVDIGKIVFRKRSWDWVEKAVKSGRRDVAFNDVVDGKQRITTILEFIQDKFADSYGNFFSDLSGKAQQEFTSYGNLILCELPEQTTDQEVIDLFLGVNHTGIPQSEEHINFVKSLRR